MTHPERDGWTWLLAIFGLGNLANGIWMLASPPSWYRLLPAAVPDFGPLNEHFVRDIGSAFCALGASLVWAAFSPRLRVPAIGFALAFNGLHAMVHVYDTASGRVSSQHWLIDLVPVYLPVAILAVALRAAVRAPA